MSDTPSQIARTLRGLDGSRRFLVLGAGVLVVAAVWFASRWASTPTYVTLFRDLELSEAGTIGDNLDKTDIPHKLGGGGTEVMVPVADVARARVALARDGLPTNGRPGLELFDKPSWGMTEFTQRVTYQRALEGELSRTIGGLRGVQRAEVHLVMPVPSPLRRLERPAAASVVLTLKPGTTLPPDAIQGITYIVSNSVEQLAAENVAVMDDAGHVLSMPSPAGSVAGATSRQLDMQRATEQHLAQKIEDLLATVVGVGRARAEISALMSFDQVDRTVESFDPDGQVLQNEQRSEAESGAAADAAGAQTIVNNTYQNTRRLEKNVGAAGAVTRLTVAVLVDEKALQAGEGGTARVSLVSIEGMVRDAVGVDSTRGDRLTVLAVPFEPSAIVAGAAAAGFEPAKADPIAIVERVSRPVVGIAALVVLLLIGFRLLRPGTGPASVSPSVPGGAPGAAGGASGAEALLMGKGLQGNGVERPEATAEVVRAWLAETR